MAVEGFTTLAVIGAGQMGSGIAQVAATAGLTVRLIDLSPAQIESAKKGMSASVERLVRKSLMTDEVAKTTLANISYAADLEAASGCDLAIEAIVENERVKDELFARLDALLPPHGILASNTSSIPITRMGAKTKRPDKFIGMHFMNPVPIMKLVEIIPGMATAPETTARILALAKAMGKQTVTSQDFPGFIVNRVLMPMINEAFCALMEGVASAEDIDNGMKLGTNQPMGPLTLADFIGLDTCLAILRVLHDGLGDPRYRPCPLLVKYVEAGYLGRKVKRGVYTY